MRIYDIVLFVFLFSLALSVVKDLNLFGNVENVGVNSPYVNGQYQYVWTQEELKNVGRISNATSEVNIQAVFSWLNAFYQFALLAIPRIVIIFFNATIGVYWLIQAIGIPEPFALTLATAIYFIYIIGMYQMFSSKSFREYS